MSSSSLTRRMLLRDGAKLAVGVGLGATATGLLSACQSAAPAGGPTAAPTAVPLAQIAQTAGVSVPAWPWPYVQLDPQRVAQKAYDSYYEGGCMYGAFNAILVSLREEAGFPFTLIPTQMSRYGEGGGVGWATLCGTLNGSAAAINLVTKDYGPVVNDLIDWYTKTAFPIMTPSSPKTNITGTSVSNSPLCHVSVTEWCQASGMKAESKERAERCARLTADVASRAVELLNNQASGQFKASYAAAPSLATCGGCHLKGGTIEDARGKMECVDCHDPHISQ